MSVAGEGGNSPRFSAIGTPSARLLCRQTLVDRGSRTAECAGNHGAGSAARVQGKELLVVGLRPGAAVV